MRVLQEFPACDSPHPDDGDGVAGAALHGVLHLAAGRLSVGGGQPHQLGRLPAGPGHPDLLSHHSAPARLQAGEHAAVDNSGAEHDTLAQDLGHPRQDGQQEGQAGLRESGLVVRVLPEQVGQPVPQPGRGQHGQDGLQAEDGDAALVCGVQRLLHKAGEGLGVDFVLLRVHGEHSPGPGGAVVEIRQEVPELRPVEHHGGGGEAVMGEDGLSEGEADGAGGQDCLDLYQLGGETVGRVSDVVILGQAVDTLGQARVDPSTMK